MECFRTVPFPVRLVLGSRDVHTSVCLAQRYKGTLRPKCFHLNICEWVVQEKAVLLDPDYKKVFYGKDNTPSNVGWILPRCKQSKLCFLLSVIPLCALCSIYLLYNCCSYGSFIVSFIIRKSF